MAFLIFLSAVLLTNLCSASSICPPAKCSPHSPDVRFPFRIPGTHPRPCGIPGFDLFCRDNSTMIRFPGYGDLAIKSISYGSNRLDLIDPKNCVHQVFLNLNMSATPFRYYYDLKEYKYVNCWEELGAPFLRVPCMSSVSHHVYVVESVAGLPVSCSLVKAVAIPFSYSPFLSDSSFGLGLTWAPIREKPEPKRITQRGHPWKLVQGMILIFLMVGIIVFYGTIISKRFEELIQEKKATSEEKVEIEDGKLLGEYQSI